MLIHKDIIIRVIFSLIFLGITLWVLGPIFMNFFKKKLPGQYSHEMDLDAMIRRQKERLRSQYGLSGDLQPTQDRKNFHELDLDDADKRSSIPPDEIKKIYHKTKWGGSQFLKELQTEITKNYSYTLTESKVSAFLLLCEKFIKLLKQT
jgi:hypothetical protein